MYSKSNESIRKLDHQIHKERKKIEEVQEEKTQLLTKLQENESSRISQTRDMRRLQEVGTGAISLIHSSM